MSTAIPFADLHAAVMAQRQHLNSGSPPHDDFTRQLIAYQLVAADSLRLDDVARTCERCAGRRDLPLDLVAAYASLAALAHWRIAQLQRGPITESTHG